jgi:signal transduction histidine kinase
MAYSHCSEKAGGLVVVEASAGADEVVVKVRDTGIGIAPEMLPHVFEPFAQGRDSVGRSRGGLGLGLSIVRNIVELHGGRVSVQSDGRGCGATFRVELPVGPDGGGEGCP